MAVLLYRGVSRISRLIQWRTWSPYSHAAWRDEWTGEVWEAWWPDGVRVLPDIHHGHTRGTVVDVFGANLELIAGAREAMTRFYRDHKGERYDLWGILGFILRRQYDKSGAWFCSEILQAASQYVGLPLVNAEPWKTSPGLIGTSTQLTFVGTEVV